MDVIGTIEMLDHPVDFAAIRVCPDGTNSTVHDAVQAENLLSVYVNDILTMQLGCSVTNLAELVVGRMFTEGLISSADEVDCLSICEQSLRADIYLSDRTADLSRKAVQSVPTCCTMNRTVNEYFAQDDELVAVKPLELDAEWVFRMTRVFLQDKTGHARTRGVHSAYLSTKNEMLCMREDIGRHNALDKVIGWALMNEVDLSRCMLFTSGRIPTDMAVKAIRSGIPILATKTVATDKAVELARNYCLTLICEATPQSFDILNDGMKRGWLSSS